MNRQALSTPRGVVIPASPLVVTHAAGETLSGHRVVIVSGGLAYHADSTDPADASRVVGITTGAATAGAPAMIQTFGEMTEPSWNWSDGAIFFDALGRLTQTPPETGFLQIVASAVSSTTIFISLQPPIIKGA